MENLISAVIPAYSSVETIKNSVCSLATQWIPDDTFLLEIIIVCDNPNMDYSYFTSDSFKPIVNKYVNIVVLKNKDNYGQGVSRQIGIESASSNWVMLCDEDDLYAPNAVYRFWEALNEQHYNGDDKKPVALIAAPIYSFDKGSIRDIIPPVSIWVNAKLYNRQFLFENEIKFPEGINSHRSEDYPFSRMVEYAVSNNKNYKRVDFKLDVDTFYYWIPNTNSRSRKETYYTALLTPATTNASCMIYEYYKRYNTKYHIEKKQDEFMKHEILNMNVFSYYSYVSYLYNVNKGWWKQSNCDEEGWELLKTSIKKLKSELMFYWREIIPYDKYVTIAEVLTKTDVKNDFVETWLGTFDEWVERGHETENMSFDEMKEYCSRLEFDEVRHEAHTDYVKAWKERNKKE